MFLTQNIFNISGGYNLQIWNGDYSLCMYETLITIKYVNVESINIKPI